MTRTVVTGGCGFIGSNLVPHLVGLGHEVTVIDNFSRGSRCFLAESAKVRIFEADIRDTGKIRTIMDGAQSVIHLAAFGSVVESVKNPGDNFSANVEGTYSVLLAARDAGIRKLIFSSTGGALIGAAPLPVSEKSVPRPISPYGASKLAGEGYCCAFAHSFGINIVALRFANVIGPISWHKGGAVTQFFKAILDGRPIRIFGSGSATRDFLYVEDLCAGICAALEKNLPEPFNVFHLASGREVTVAELAHAIIRAAGSEGHPIQFEPSRVGEVERNFATSELAKAVIGFSPTHSLEQGLAKTWEWFKAQHAAKQDT